MSEKIYLNNWCSKNCSYLLHMYYKLHNFNSLCGIILLFEMNKFCFKCCCNKLSLSTFIFKNLSRILLTLLRQKFRRSSVFLDSLWAEFPIMFRIIFYWNLQPFLEFFKMSIQIFLTYLTYLVMIRVRQLQDI